MHRANKWASSWNILILLTFGLLVGGQSCVKWDHDFGAGTVTISHTTFNVSIPPNKDSAVVLDSIGWHPGDSIIVNVEGDGVIIWELSGTHRFKDQLGVTVTSAFGYNVSPATSPLRTDGKAPYLSILLNSYGSYVLRYDSTEVEGRIWEIDS